MSPAIQRLFSLTLASALLTGCTHAAPSTARAEKSDEGAWRTSAAPRQELASLSGYYLMHIYIGGRLFDDQVMLHVDRDGRVSGKLTVPDRFTAAIERGQTDGRRLRFEIVAEEGQGPFRVRYEGEFSQDRKQLAGFATLEDGSLLGGFVAERKKALPLLSVKPFLIQPQRALNRISV